MATGTRARRDAPRRFARITFGFGLGLASACGPATPSNTPTDTPTATAAATQTATGAPATPTGAAGTPTSTRPQVTPTASPTAELTPTGTATSTPSTSECPEEGPSDALHCAVEVRFDAQGTPHIYAASEHDLFFTQGWLAGQDRLFQMEGNRLQALGRQTELYGAGRLNDDLFMRMFEPERHGREELARWSAEMPRQLKWVESYVAGVNAYLEAAVAGRNGARLPESYRRIGYVPQPFTVEEVLGMDNLFALSLGPDPLLELQITIIKLLLPPATFNDLLRTAPIEPAFTAVDAAIPAGEEGGPPRPGGGGREGVPASVLDTYDPQLAAWLRPLLSDPVKVQQMRDAVTGLRQTGARLFNRASNGWAIAGEHTATGGALLANDAHMGMSLPGTFFQVHLNTRDAGGELDLMGLALPGLPGVTLGHNRYIGWGLTTSFFDMTDLYLEAPAPTDPSGSVLFDGQAVAMTSRQETFRVRQDDGSFLTETRELKIVPHHGPVVPAAALGLPEELLLSLRWAGAQEGSVASTVLQLNLARQLSRVEEIMEDHRIGAGNWFFASVDGDVAYDPRVRLPVRQVASGLNPPWAAMPGTGGYEWNGWIPAADMPFVYDPPAGFVVTANNDPAGGTGDGDPLNDPYYFGGVFDSGMRARRVDAWIREKITDGTPLDADAMRELQADNFSYLASRLVPYLLDAASRRPELLTPAMAEAIDVMAGWDFHMTGDGVAPTLYMSWWPRAVFEVAADDIGEELFGWYTGDVGQYLARPLLHFLDVTAARIDQIDAGGRFPSQSGTNYFDDLSTEGVLETRDEQLLDAWRVAVEHQTALRGADSAAWRWTDQHPLSMGNPEGRFVEGLSRGPYARAGYGFTVDCTEGVQMVDGMPPSEFSINKASAFRHVMDFSDGRIVGTNVLAGGQREQGDDPHYDDQLDDWSVFGVVPQPFERDEVVRETAGQWELSAGFPAGDTELVRF